MARHALQSTIDDKRHTDTAIVTNRPFFIFSIGTGGAWLRVAMWVTMSTGRGLRRYAICDVDERWWCILGKDSTRPLFLEDDITCDE